MATIIVNCAAGAKLQTAINAALAGDVIVVQGTCTENVSIPDEAVRLTIDGQGSGVIRATSATATAMQVLGRNITITRLTITGGRSAIGVLRGGSALIDGNTIQQTTGSGIVVHQNGHARIVNNTIQFNPLNGISVQEGSVARIGFLDNAGPILGNVIQHNGAAGIAVVRGSSATILGNVLSENDGSGVSVTGTSHALVSGNRIDHNGGDGVTVSQNGDVELGGAGGIFEAANETTVPNAGAGVRCSVNGSLSGSLGGLDGAQGQRKADASCAAGSKIG
jgi:parallel beta-helix repeat protein